MAEEAVLKTKSRQNENLLVVLATVLAMAAMYWLGPLPVPHRNSLSTRLGRLETADGVRLRYRGSLQWQFISENTEIFSGDVVYTPEDSRSVVTFADDQTLTLEPNTMVQFNESSTERYELTLIYGKLEPSALLKNKIRIRTMAPSRSVGELFKMLRLDVAAPLADPSTVLTELSKVTGKAKDFLGKKISMESVGKVKDVPLPTLNTLGDYELYLVSPNPGARAIFGVDGFTKYSWTPVPVPAGEYVFEISRDPAFTRAITHKTKRNRIELKVLDPGTYYWRVAVKDGARKTKGSEVRTVEVVPR